MTYTNGVASLSSVFITKYFFYFFKDCGRTRTQKGPQHGPSTIMRKNTIKKIKKEFKRFKNE